MGSSRKSPSPKQLAALRRLAMQRGQSFVYPRTSGQASAEMRRLLRMEPQDSLERRLDDEGVSDDMATRRGDAAQVRLEEIEGYGSSATWARGR
jgi:hypothetical protein